MPRLQCTLSDSQCRELAAHASRHGVTGAGKFLALLCRAYLAVMERTHPSRAADPATVHDEVARMFDEYQRGEAPEYGRAPVQKRNRHG